MVNGCVNVISGEYQESHTDFAMPGAIPLNVQRYYCSGGCRKHSFLYGWQLSHGAKLLSYRSKHDHDCAVLKGSDRHGIQFKGRRHQHELACPDSFFRKSVSNCAFGEISAKTNLKNDRLHKSQGQYELLAADQTCYRFAKSSHDPEREKGTHGYRLEEMELPDGSSYRYKYGQTFGMPTSIGLINRKGDKIAGLKLESNPNQFRFQIKPELTFVTSTGEKICYKFALYGNNHKKRAILSEVHSPHAPKIKYFYEAIRGHTKQKRLRKRELPDQRVLEISYNGDDKVQKLISPAGAGNETVATHQFYYSKNGNEQATKVVNALGGRTKYRWSKKTRRLNSIETYDDQGRRIVAEKYRWGNASNDASHLTARIVEDADGQLLAFQKYQYDSHGNITCLSLYGNLTGNSSQPVFIDKSLKSPPKEKCDLYQIRYEYDDSHRRISEDDGKILQRYSYVDSTDLLAAHYSIYDGRIQLRRFYQYDVCGAICQEISDDGFSENPHELTAVTERQIKRTKCTPTGLPEIVKEWSLDIASGDLLLNRKTVNTYDQHGWLVEQSVYDSEKHLAYTLEWHYDTHGNVIYEKDALGHVTRSDYDDNDNLIYEKKPDLAASHFLYDCMNRLVLERQEDPKGEILSKRYSYDAMGNQIACTDIYGKKTRHEYDAQGRLTKTIYPVINSNHERPTVAYARNALGLATCITNAEGHTTAIEYNLRGKPVKITYPDGTSEKRTYTLWGELAETQARDGSRIRYGYDSQGREITKEWLDAKGDILKTETKEYNALHLLRDIDSHGIITHYTYDAAGRLASERTKRRRTFYSYDTLGRKTSTSQALGYDQVLTSVEVFDALDRVVASYTQYPDGEIASRIYKSYDAQGNEIELREHNQAGTAITTTEYDSFGRVVKVTNPLGDVTHTTYHHDRAPRQEVTDPRGVRTVTTYNPFGHPLIEQRFDPMGSLVEQLEYSYDANGNKVLRRVITDKEPIETHWRYDSLNQLKEAVYAAGTRDQRSLQRHYDESGRLVALIKNDGITLHYTYDSLGRKTSLKSSDKTLSYRYKYDKNDNLLSAKDKINGTAVRRSYDEHGELISDTLPYGHTLSYAYDLLGNVKQIILPDESEILYSREGGRLHSIRRRGALSYTHTYSQYDSAANPTQILLPAEAGTLKIDYDLLNRPRRIKAPQWQENLEYEAHLLKQRTLRDDFGKTISSYAYDAKEQLLSEDGAATHTLEYDWRGNPIAYDGHSRKFNACNALVRDQEHRYSYDRNGNRTGDGVNTYRYDALDRLIEAKTPTGTYRYVYDALGRRVARTHGKKSTYFIWQKQQEIGTISSAGVIEELQILNPSNHGIAFELQGALYIPLHDIFGHVRALIDSSGDSVATYRYSAFGEEEITGIVLSPWRYAGKRIDTETGFIYFGERYYDPSTLCWLTPDPLEDADGPNLYMYVHNNPLFYVDPDGCFSFPNFIASPTMSTLATGLAIAVDIALLASVVGSGFTGIAEGFLAGCSGGISGTAIDLAFDATALYGEGGLATAYAGAEASTISYHASKTLGRVAGAAFSLTPQGKALQASMNAASTATTVAKGANTAVQATKAVSKAKNASTVAARSVKSAKAVANGQKLGYITPKILEGNKTGGLKHIMKRHAFESTAKDTSKFLAGMDRTEISELVFAGCKKINTWQIQENKMLTGVYDAGKIIGTSMKNGSQTSFLKVVIKGDVLHSAYPF